MSKWSNRNYGDENHFDDEDEFYLNPEFWDEDEDDNIDLGGALVPNHPYPNGPSRGDTIVIEKELALS